MASITYQKYSHHDFNTDKDIYVPVTIESTEPTCVETAWIAPDGTFWPVAFANHDNFATAVCERDGINKLKSDYGAVGALERTNWVHVSGGEFRNVRRILSNQIETLFDWMLACGVDTSMGRKLKSKIDQYSNDN